MQFNVHKLPLAALITIFMFIVFPATTLANIRWVPEDGSQCSDVGDCIDNRKCIYLETKTDEASGDKLLIFGEGAANTCNSQSTQAVQAPEGVRQFDIAVSDGSGNSIGIIAFLSNLLRVFAVIAGIWAMFNFIMAGYIYITSMSDPGATSKVANKITMTVVGLAIIAGAYTLAAIISWVMFGDPSFILNPTLYSALGN